MPHASRMSPSCFGFLIQSSHVQPIKSGHVPATSEFPVPSEFPFIALSAQIPTLDEGQAMPRARGTVFLFSEFVKEGSPFACQSMPSLG